MYASWHLRTEIYLGIPFLTVLPEILLAVQQSYREALFHICPSFHSNDILICPSCSLWTDEVQQVYFALHLPKTFLWLYDPTSFQKWPLHFRMVNQVNCLAKFVKDEYISKNARGKQAFLCFVRRRFFGLLFLFLVNLLYLYTFLRYTAPFTACWKNAVSFLSVLILLQCICYIVCRILSDNRILSFICMVYVFVYYFSKLR